MVHSGTRIANKEATLLWTTGANHFHQAPPVLGRIEILVFGPNSPCFDCVCVQRAFPGGEGEESIYLLALLRMHLKYAGENVPLAPLTPAATFFVSVPERDHRAASCFILRVAAI